MTFNSFLRDGEKIELSIGFQNQFDIKLHISVIKLRVEVVELTQISANVYESENVHTGGALIARYISIIITCKNDDGTTMAK